MAYEILNEAFASTYRSAHPNAIKVAETVRAMSARLKRSVTIQQVAEERSWERAVAYK